MRLIHLLIFMIVSLFAHAQCGDGLLDICTGDKGNYTFAKAFRIEMSNNNVSGSSEMKRYSYLFTRNTKYRIICCSDQMSQGKMIIELYGPSGLISSTYNSANNEHSGAIEYDCQATNRYVLNFYFEGGSEGCGIGLVTFRSHF